MSNEAGGIGWDLQPILIIMIVIMMVTADYSRDPIGHDDGTYLLSPHGKLPSPSMSQLYGLEPDSFPSVFLMEPICPFLHEF